MIVSHQDPPFIIIKTHDSESRDQEEAGCMQQMSELFTGSTTLKFVNALNNESYSSCI